MDDTFSRDLYLDDLKVGDRYRTGE